MSLYATFGGDTSFKPYPSRVLGAAETVVVLNAMPYARTVTCGSYTITGTYTGPLPEWSASPSGTTGTCEDDGGGAFFCIVSVSPDAVGEGVETITIANETVDIGFYVAGSHTCFLAQNVDGDYNATLANLDAVSAWENLGTSENVTQAVAGSKPTFRTGMVGGQPMVRCDGGDRMAAATVGNWTFLSNGTDWTVEHVGRTAATNPNALQVIAATSDASTTSNRGTFLGLDDRAASSRNDRISALMSSGSAFILNATSATNDIAPQQKFNIGQWVLDEGGGTEFVATINGAAGISTASVTGYSASAPQFALNICTASSAFPFTGDLFVIRIYQSVLTATQQGINKAVDEWALGGSFPVDAPMYWVTSSSSGDITTAGSTVSSWRSNGAITANFTQGTAGQRPSSTVSGTSSVVDFDGTDDFVSIGSQPTTSNIHIFVVATIDSIGTNGTGASCNANDGLAGWTTYGGLKMRTSGGVAYVIAHNFDGSHDCTETTFTIGQKTIFEMKIDGTNISVAVNGGSFTSTPSGNTSSASASAIIGAQDASNNYMDGKVHEVMYFGDDLGTTARAAVISGLQARWGL